MRFLALLVCCVALGPAWQADGQTPRVLFIGNSFTYAAGSAAQYYRSPTVVDLNGQGKGGIPALFKVFADQAGLHYEVYLETHPGSGIDFHLDTKRREIGSRPWDIVVAHGQSTLDFDAPGNPAKLVATTRQLVDFLRTNHAAVALYLMATWSRADQTYLPGGAWYGKPIEAMARDVRAGYDRSATGTPGVRGVIPVGEAWNRAMQAGVADANPYDGIEAGRVNLWTYDAYHASAYGSYLEALVVFGVLTGQDPRMLGPGECAGHELGLSTAQVAALQQVAFEELAARPGASLQPVQAPAAAGAPQRCPAATSGRAPQAAPLPE